ncbi:MAG TPA: ABC transporter ATP-binding protein [Micrococcaceae bacterium]
MPPALIIDGLIKDVGPVPGLDGRMKRVVSDVSLTAHYGQVTALLGTNGAGKTTTLECAQGLQKRTGGSISLLGRDPDTADAGLRARVGVMLQEGGLPPSASPLPLLRHISGMYASPRPLEPLVERLGINDFGATTIRRLSGGQKQRVALAASLIGNPELLFLDEPSAGLDPQSRQLVFELIEELRTDGLAIVLTTHLLDDAQKLADYVYIIDNGRSVARGTVAELIAGAGTGSVRSLTFSAPPGLDVAAVLRADLEALEERPGSYTVSGELRPADLAALGAWWAAAGIMPAALAMESKNLEDVFLALAGQEQLEQS